ncbi:MAG: response regulator [Verrucomicrobia bacterium]|nr:response regulator [Verrucomicrobiota bacterium]
MIRALLIDDEAIARDALAALLRAHPEIVVVGAAATVGQAQEALTRTDYDVVFLDIQLRGGSGFDLVPRVRAGAEIVFVTAHDEYALRAFEVNALDYLLKPVHPERLARSVRRLGRRSEGAAPPAEGAGWSRLREDDTVFLKLDAGARFTRVADLVAVLSCENYTEVLLAGGEKLLVRRTLKAWEEALPRPPFARAHRQALVNLARLIRVEDDGGDGPLLHLAGLAAPLRASRREWPALRSMLPRQSGEAFRPGA